MEDIRKEDATHEHNINADIADMEKKLKLYVDKGSVAGSVEVREEPVISAKTDVSLIKPLEKISSFSGSFVAVDCSTRTLKRANNWGIYLMRVAYASVKEREVNWDYQERLCTVVGDARTRSNFLTDVRIELESHMALDLLQNKTYILYYEHANPRSNYLLLDGGGYFGGERKFRVALYEECEKDGISLLAISKNSPSLHDEKGRDLIATTSILSPFSTWVFHPVREADKDQSLYGDISLVKLCGESPRVFRCDDQNRIVCLSASAVAECYKRIWEENYEEWQRLPTLLITLEEAHEFLDPNKPRTIFSDIALTYRKYRVGLNAVTPRPSRINFDVFAELWTKVIMKTELRKDRAYLTENTPYLEYSDTEIKMLDVGEALLISEPKIRFAVPIRVTHYPEYLDNRGKEDYGLSESQSLSEMEKRLKRLSQQESFSP